MIAVVNIRKEPSYRREAVVVGLKRLGYAIKDGWGHCPADHKDLLVIWNRKAGSEHNAATLWEQRGGTVLVMENGYLQKVDKTMYAISVGGHNGSGWFPQGTEDRFSKLGFEVKPWQPTLGGHWLVCGQRGIGSPTMASPPQWAEKTYVALKRKGVNVRLRAHPGNSDPKVLLLHDLRGAQNFVVWSSGAGVRALVEGVPGYYAAPHWICSEAANPLAEMAGWSSGLAAAHSSFEREAALNYMAHGQWHVDEIATGEPFKRILENLPC